MARKLLLLLLVPFTSQSQTVLNGDFENNVAGGDLINLSNASFNFYMSDSYSFGTNGNLDIIASTTYCGIGPESGTWYVAFTGGGTDALSLKINQPLQQGNSYTISFADKFCNFNNYINHRYVFGLSETEDNLGTTIHTAAYPTEDEWTQKEFTFEAPNNGQYLTITVDSGDAISTWEQIDDVKFTGKPSDIPQVNWNLLFLYPNPANGLISVAGDVLWHEVRISDALGQLISIHGNELKTLDLSTLSNGVYVFEFLNNNREVIARRKVVKSN